MARSDPFLQHLAEVPLFSALSKKDLQAVARHAELVKAEAGTVIVTEGAAGSEFFVILDGRARVERHGRQVALLGAGGFFGDLALLDRAPRNASVVAETPMHLLAFNIAAFKKLLEEMPGTRDVVMKVLEARAEENRAREG